MKKVFADTYYFLALLSGEDAGHQAAAAFNRSFQGLTVTSDWIILEVADALASRARRRSVGRMLFEISRNSAYQVIRANVADFESGLSLYEARPDKDWSLTDCISFVIMERMGISDAITGDRHFIQAGFNILLTKNAS